MYIMSTSDIWVNYLQFFGREKKCMAALRRQTIRSATASQYTIPAVGVKRVNLNFEYSLIIMIFSYNLDSLFATLKVFILQLETNNKLNF